MKKPIIGVTLDWQEKGTFSKRPHYALREHYFQAVSKAGGLPFGIGYDPENIDNYLEQIDGIVIPGGFFASPEDWYIGGEVSPYEKSPRLDSDLNMIKSVLDKNIPMLGICAGMQLLGGLMGCKMTKDAQKYANSPIDHINEKPAEEKAHSVKVTEGTLLHKITELGDFDVNTAHREAIVQVVDGVVVNAVAPDGIIEGIELPAYKFALGVQWHPEFFLEDNDPSFKLFKALVKAAGDK